MQKRPIPPSTEYPQDLNTEFNAFLDRLDEAKKLPADDRADVLDEVIRALLLKQYEYARIAHHDAIDVGM